MFITRNINRITFHENGTTFAAICTILNAKGTTCYAQDMYRIIY